MLSQPELLLCGDLEEENQDTVIMQWSPFTLYNKGNLVKMR